MRKLIATVFNYSLDGLLADEDTDFWKFCFSLPENQEPDDPAQLDFLQSAYAHIMGRTAYEAIAEAMTTATDHPFADMEDVLEVYTRPYDPKRPQVCMDEVSKQHLADPRPARPTQPGRGRRVDYEYERRGTANLFLCCEPLRGWRSVTVTDRRTRIDWASMIKDLIDVHYPEADKVVLVLDNLNTHTPGSLYVVLP